MNPTQLSAIIGIDTKEIRKYARKTFTKTEGNWNFSEAQIQIITSHFKGHTPSNKATQTVAAISKPETLSITIPELTEIAKAFLKEKYNMQLNIPIVLNTRISKRLGTFYHKRGYKSSTRIDIGTNTINHYPRETVIDVLKHELTHYAAYEMDMPYRDGDHYFENELKKNGIGATKTIQAKGVFHQYNCSDCNKSVSTSKRPMKNPGNYRSRCCKAELVYIGMVTL